MIINNSGGGAPLNFKVVGGTSQPANPKENTIWVNTSVGISSWGMIKDIAPNWSVPEGTVYIFIEAAAGGSESVFNALKSNEISLRLIGAKQYVGGAYVNKEVKLYQNGAWHLIITDNYLFKLGGEVAPETGGWTYTGYRFASNSPCNGGQIINGEIRTTGVPNHYMGCLGTALPVDLTKYSRLAVQGWSLSSHRVICICTNRAAIGDSTVATIWLPNAYTNDYYYLDISGLNGAYYIVAISQADNNDMYIYNIRLEK